MSFQINLGSWGSGLAVWSHFVSSFSFFYFLKQVSIYLSSFTKIFGCQPPEVVCRLRNFRLSISVGVSDLLIILDEPFLH